MERESARLPTTVWGKVDPQESDLICDFQTFPAGSAFPQHLRCQIRDSRFARWIRGTATADNQDIVGKRKLVLLDDQQLQPICQLTGDDRRERDTRRWSELGRLAPIKGPLL